MFSGYGNASNPLSHASIYASSFRSVAATRVVYGANGYRIV